MDKYPCYVLDDLVSNERQEKLAIKEGLQDTKTGMCVCGILMLAVVAFMVLA